MLKDVYRGTVTKVDLASNKPYALAYCEELGEPVYISLLEADKVWNANIEPSDSMVVDLHEVFLAAKGWRAKRANPILAKSGQAARLNASGGVR